MSETAILSAWMPHIQSQAHYAQSDERRCRRWLENPAVQSGQIYAPLVIQALKEWGPHSLVLALDTSMVFGRFCLIRVVVVFRGRAITLVQKVIEHESAQVSTEQLLPILAEVKGMLDFLGIVEVRFLADRGFCDTELMSWLRWCHWHYRIRIKSNLILFSPDGERICKVGEIKLHPRESRFLHNVAITGHLFGPVHVALFRPTDVPEQWQIVSDEPTDINTFDEYGERFQIEEGFLDDKSNLFGLESSKLRDAPSLERLVTVLSGYRVQFRSFGKSTLTPSTSPASHFCLLALLGVMMQSSLGSYLAAATLFAVSEGLSVVERGLRRMIDPHWQRGISYLKLGLRAMHHCLSRGQPFFERLTLHGGPDPEPLGFRRNNSLPPSALLEVGWVIDFRCP
ncbi:hypothetical protein Dxin01_02684 [Deinococcus xinjiangensis]|uniref:Transposase IS4-like domain-containing protein n=2 Tax=Deinococcus xinjiangensis TaxID=457454 RepID=A0ABP9VCI4_9DEIO